MTETVANGPHATGERPAVAEQRLLLDVADVEALTGFKKSWIWAQTKLGKFPKPRRCGSTTRWRRSDVLRWVDDLPDQPDEDAPT